METNLEELLGIIAHNAIVINRQDRSLAQLTAAYNEKSQALEAMAKLNQDVTAHLNKVLSEPRVLDFERAYDEAKKAVEEANAEETASEIMDRLEKPAEG